MKLFVDGTPLMAGGGVQVAIAFLMKLRHEPGVDWCAVLPRRIAAQLPQELAADARVAFVSKDGILDRLRIRALLPGQVQRHAADVVFTVFGPAYFSARCPHVVGFALPKMIYPRTEKGLLLLWEIMKDVIRRRLLRRADLLVVETHTVRERLAAILGIDVQRIAVVGNTVNPVLQALPLRPGPVDGPFQVLVPSAYYPHKNLEFVPAVARALRELAPQLPFRFVLTLAPDSRSWRRIERLARGLGVAAQVQTAGVLRLPELAKAYGESSAVFLPTLLEASTAVYPEAFHFQRPLVTSDLPFARELCADAAVYVSPTDAAATAGRIHALAVSPGQRAALVQAGRARLATGYPEPAAQFQQQMAVLRRAAAGALVRPGRAPS